MANRKYIDIKKSKILAIKNESHKELEPDWRLITDYSNSGYLIYATNDEGIFFFINNRLEDGNDWCLITKVDAKNA